MGEDSSPAEAFESTLLHLGLLVDKRDRLASKASEVAEALLAQLARADLSMHEKVDVWLQVRDYDVPGLAARACRAMGTSSAQVAHFARFPAGLHKPGEFPIGYADLPNKGPPCVYLLLDDDLRCLYVGQSQQVKARLKSHWRGDAIPTTRYEVVVCADHADALQLEADLIFQHQPPYNRAGIKSRGYVS